MIMSSQKQYCSPCLLGKLERAAVIYCAECQESICEECKNTHGRIKVLMHHQLCNVEKAPPLAVRHLLKRLTACSIHDNEEIIFLCKDHGTTFCNKCLLSSHRKCDNVQLLSDIPLDKQDFSDCQNAFSAVEESAKKLLQHEEKQEQMLSEIQDDVKTQLGLIKTKIFKLFTQLETNVLEEMACKKLAIQSTINNQKHDVEQLLMEVQSKRNMIESVVKHGNRQHVFLMKENVVKDFIDKLALSERGLNGTRSKMSLRLKENHAMDPLLAQLSSAFTLEEVNCDEMQLSSDFVTDEFNYRHRVPHLIGDISLPEHSYRDSVLISCVWIGEYVVIARGSRLFVVDIEEMDIISTRRCKAKLGSVTKIDQSTIVVYLRKTSMIEFIHFSEGQLTTVKEIYTKTAYQGVFGVEHLGRLICVSPDNGTLDFLNKDGKILQECILDDHAARTITFAKYCVFNNRNQTLYMSCSELYQIIGIHLSGRVVFEYHLGDYTVPSQCVIDPEDNLYVTTEGPFEDDSVVQISHTGELVRKMLPGELRRPGGICFNDSFEQFVVVGKTLTVFSYN